MTALLRDLQRRFAASLTGSHAEPRVAVYRNTVAANYRNALGATYAVVRELTGVPFFNAAVDAFTAAHPSTCGDLNVYGREFADFLAEYPHARNLPYLPDVARLEWAIDEASRAADNATSAQDVLAALGNVPSDAVIRQTFTLDASCRLVHSPFPVMRIWQVHQSDGDKRVDLEAGPDHLLVRRERDTPSIARLSRADFAFLTALADGRDLGSAFEDAVAVDGDFDLAGALGTFVRDGTVAALG